MLQKIKHALKKGQVERVIRKAKSNELNGAHAAGLEFLLEAVYNTNIARGLKDLLSDDYEDTRRNFQELEQLIGPSITGRPLVDLGCGFAGSISAMYDIAARLGASHYIGVDSSPHFDDSFIVAREYSRVSEDVALRTEKSPPKGSIIKQDMLRYVYNMQGSANFVMNGIDGAIKPHQYRSIIAYMDLLFKCISSRLEQGGVLLGYGSQPWLGPAYTEPLDIGRYNLVRIKHSITTPADFIELVILKRT